MKVSMFNSGGASPESVAALAPMVEDLGYHALWRAEGVHWDAFSVCTLWAERTTRLGIATGIVSAVTRHSGALARAAITLQQQSGGRFRLGLGIGNNPEVPQPASPLQTMEDVTADVRKHWRAGLVPDVTQPAPPVWFAALRPKMVALAARVSDGVLLNWVTRDYVRQVRAQVGPNFPIACSVRACIGPRDQAISALRANLPFYLAIPVYRKAFELQGIDPDRVTDDAALGLVIHDRAELAAWREAGVDELVLRPVGADDAATIRALAPA